MKASAIGIPTYELKVTCGAFCQGGMVDYEPTSYPECTNADEVWVRGADAAAMALRMEDAERLILQLPCRCLNLGDGEYIECDRCKFLHGATVRESVSHD